MERRANAIFAGKNKNSFSSMSASLNSKENDADVGIKKNRYVTNILNKSNKRDVASLGRSKKSVQTVTATNCQTTDSETTLRKDQEEFDKNARSITEESKSPDLLATSINSNSGTL